MIGEYYKVYLKIINKNAIKKIFKDYQDQLT